eukprot:TRINITY_DN11143_c0_g1_i1.p1 TRINITY_DN11143_c0_g1~~TRINITY_DN11143_c0_g1_i1.p1  ORF type:complete len:226 (+),score=51.93 TRINITY_DN11143_c0_g1_i1:175-852(+)
MGFMGRKSNNMKGEEGGLEAIEGEGASEIDRALSLVGGRPLHLHTIQSYVKRGLSLVEACDSLENETISHLLAAGYGGHFADNSSPGKWSKTQVWKLMVKLSEEGVTEVREDAVVSSLFKGNHEILQSLAQNNIFEFKKKGPHLYVSASPLHLNCYRKIVRDDVTRAHMTRLLKETAVADLKADIVAVETELEHIHLAGTGQGLTARSRALDRTLLDLQNQMAAL